MAPDPAGDVDMGWQLACECMKQDGALKREYENRFGQGGRPLSESEANEAIDLFRDYFRRNKSTCGHCEEAYRFWNLLKRARDRGTPSLHRSARERWAR